MKKIILTAAVITAAAFTGCSHPNSSPTATTPPASPTPNISGNGPAPITPNTTPTAPVHQAVIYTVDNLHGSDTNHYLVKQTVTLASDHDPAREALEALLHAENSPIPAGTRLLSIKIEDDLATVDFSRSPVDEMEGEEKQSQALEAIQRTLGQFQNISRIQILVGGQPPASLGQAAGGPIDVLRPGEDLGASGGA